MRSVSPRLARNSTSLDPMYPEPPVITYFMPLPSSRCGRPSLVLPIRSLRLLRSPPATWRRGYAAACKAVYTGSIPVVAFSSPGSRKAFLEPVVGVGFVVERVDLLVPGRAVELSGLAQPPVGLQ